MSPVRCLYRLEHRRNICGGRRVPMVCMCHCCSDQDRCQDPSCLQSWHSTALVAQPFGCTIYRFARRWQQVVAERRASTATQTQPAASGAAQSDAVGLEALLSPAAGGLLQQLLLCTSCQVTWCQRSLKPRSSLPEVHARFAIPFVAWHLSGLLSLLHAPLGYKIHNTPRPRQCVRFMRLSVAP